ncbi:MAG: diaminopimelate epimerase [Acidobacteriota bacterium]
MKTIPFWKMSGAGNDFIVLDGRDRAVGRLGKDFMRKVCQRSLSVGGDGVIVLFPSERYDFQVRFFNPDGSRSRFCGNGSRCASRYAYLNGMAGRKLRFRGDDGVHEAVVQGDRVSVSIPGFRNYRSVASVHAAGRKWHGAIMDIGVPHFVTEAEDIETLDLYLYGRALRHHKSFEPAGTNVNFIRFERDCAVTIRSFERGVERETLSCGSGCIAAAIHAALTKNVRSPVKLYTRSTVDLRVFFRRKDQEIRDIFLEGDARIIHKGEICPEALSGF